ncbi:MAG: heme o synthase [Chitinophagales bacterium]|nr:heme o synthase [Chitinophagales bacterium]
MNTSNQVSGSVVSGAASHALSARISLKIQDYLELIKFRLTLLVVFSAAVGFLTGVKGSYPLSHLFWLIVGGIAITGASNAINQILEKDIDKLMTRTCNRPLAAGRMANIEALVIAGVLGVGGIILLWQTFNATAGVLASISLLSYAFIYTPLKRVHSIAVLVGAIPGALPIGIGYVCATGELDLIALVLFGIQFLWQFPHFWSIAWVQYDDYLKANIMLLPSSNGKDKFSAFQNVLYSFTLLVLSIIPYYLGWIGLAGALVVIFMGVMFFVQSLQLWIRCDDQSARKLMLGSFAYLPVVQLAMLIDKTF